MRTTRDGQISRPALDMSKHIGGSLTADPLGAARVFLCHACDDHPYADYLHQILKKRVAVWYDHALDPDSRLLVGGGLGRLPLAREEIAKCDYFVFLASRASMLDNSYAFEELSIATSLLIKRGVPLGIICVDKFEIPEEYRNRVFDSLSWTTRKQDSERIVEAVANELLRIAGWRVLPDNPLNVGFFGGANLNSLLEGSQPDRIRGVYRLNAPYRHGDMTDAIDYVRNLPAARQSQIVEWLLSIFKHDEPSVVVARQNAAFLLSKIAAGDSTIARLLRRRYPPDEEPFFYRGFHIALALLGDEDTFEDYVRRLAREPSAPWNAQRTINREFHTFYYGSEAGALAELRTTMRSLRPRTLLGLSVFTLGELSQSVVDCDLLKERRGELIASGVDSWIIEQALSKIRERIR